MAYLSISLMVILIVLEVASIATHLTLSLKKKRAINRNTDGIDAIREEMTVLKDKIKELECDCGK
ncbi:MAG: hypothetical protein FWC00_04020 [Firmicutes bacterium]|nr:hypothetical protein [Bacillota bacterium]